MSNWYNIRAIALTLLSILVGCSPTSEPAPRSQGASIATSSTPIAQETRVSRAPSITSSPQVPKPTIRPEIINLNDHPILPQPTPEQPIGGGTVSSGPFSITLLLYTDSRMREIDAMAPWAYSNLPGTGVYANWVYHGPMLGSVTWRCGVEDHLSSVCGGGSYDVLKDGMNGGRGGGGVLLAGGEANPVTNKAGDTVRWILEITTQGQTYGAALQFTLRDGSNGFEAEAITVEPLQVE
jgi:hypothetical protein